MHISEGVLRPEILLAGAAVSTVLVGWAFKTLRHEEIPKTAVLCALFFIASFIHVPVGPASMHLVLGGIVGAFLGMRVFVAVFVGLLLQGLLFGYGGVSTLGVNVFNIATPALLGYGLFEASKKREKFKSLWWFLVGFVPLSVSASLLSLALALNGEAFVGVAKVIFAAHFPLMVVEGVITLFALAFVQKVSPRLLERAS
ncbi:cobalt transporter CbiM [Sulfurospirillum sp. T05]|uniref:Cobalt transporter CbiM n=1 Tax=Sulfurospirillum tamanense TaxID=2813362 RepID=A0ABS2WR51_9BACT|nr:cobalt transporter CbiM [Sulfurospirillum tamanensis]MBN2964005.1 cobalt transporter CbiM [Sulfurospirillum tamanensis]